jgi:NhaP-type Na+/H+ or K+/H+ antiporter
MAYNLWFVVIGLLLVLMAMAGSTLKRLPLSAAMLYLAAGVALGSHGLGMIRLDPVADAGFLERFTEVAVLISLFSAGLKLRVPLDDGRWRLPLRLATVSIAITVGLIAAVGYAWLGLTPGAAVRLGAILAPTDPVLASDVAVSHSDDRVRFALTGEAGLNDGTAFPFVMLGPGLCGHHDLGAWGWRWLAFDVAWAVAAGLTVGGLLGTLVGRLVLHLRREHREAVGLDDFLALGLVALAYGTAMLAGGYGFLAVFAAGLALRRVERSKGGAEAPREVVAAAQAGDRAATDPEAAPAYMAETALGFSEQIERILEVAAMLLVGGMLTRRRWPHEAIWLVPLLFLAIRPAAVLLGLLGAPAAPFRRAYMAWFGIRGIGSLYDLSFAASHGLPPATAERLASLTLAAVAASIVAHGVSVTPLMARYGRVAAERRKARGAGDGPPP